MTDIRLVNVKPLMTSGWHLVQTGESNRFIQSRSLADVPAVDIVDKIASFLEQEDNWLLLRDCWLENDRSEDLRDLLKRALES